MDNKFFTFIRPYLGYIDSGKMFRQPIGYVYLALAIINALLPLYIMYQAADHNVFDAPAKVVVVFLILWLIIAAAGWVSFQIWWDRKSKVNETSSEGDEFVAIPVYSHFVQTAGEWAGTWFAVVGFFFGIFTELVEESRMIGSYIPGGFLRGGGIESAIISVIAGYLIIVLSRAAAEMLRAIVSIANNTRK
jgi:hypothetical protein